jgi:hypothetical protein
MKQNLIGKTPYLFWYPDKMSPDETKHHKNFMSPKFFSDEKRPWNKISVAEPELVERQLYSGAGAEVYLARLRSRVYKFL